MKIVNVFLRLMNHNFCDGSITGWIEYKYLDQIEKTLITEKDYNFLKTSFENGSIKEVIYEELSKEKMLKSKIETQLEELKAEFPEEVITLGSNGLVDGFWIETSPHKTFAPLKI